MRSKFLWVLLFAMMSSPAAASWDQGHQCETGGNGFHLTKYWGGSAGTLLRIEYYGYLAERCTADSAAGHQLNFSVRLNGRPGVFQETSCDTYTDHHGTHPYAVVEIRSDDARTGTLGGTVAPWFFEGIDRGSQWGLEIYVRATTGEYDSRYGQNYHFCL